MHWVLQEQTQSQTTNECLSVASWINQSADTCIRVVGAIDENNKFDEQITSLVLM